jgi:hypothetical protein
MDPLRMVRARLVCRWFFRDTADLKVWRPKWDCRTLPYMRVAPSDGSVCFGGSGPTPGLKPLGGR